MWSLGTISHHSSYCLLRKQQQNGIVCFTNGSINFFDQGSWITSVRIPYCLACWHVSCLDWFLKQGMFLPLAHLCAIAIGGRGVFQRNVGNLTSFSLFETANINIVWDTFAAKRHDSEPRTSLWDPQAPIISVGWRQGDNHLCNISRALQVDKNHSTRSHFEQTFLLTNGTIRCHFAKQVTKEGLRG